MRFRGTTCTPAGWALMVSSAAMTTMIGFALGMQHATDPDHLATARRMKADGHTARDIAKFLGVGRATAYRYLTTCAGSP